jgi:hypothetical protein
MARPLWQILMSLAEPESRFTCEECFAVMSFFADQLESGVDPDELHDPVARHLARCPECHVKMRDWIEELKS